jgi:hypothetical protein
MAQQIVSAGSCDFVVVEIMKKKVKLPLSLETFDSGIGVPSFVMTIASLNCRMFRFRYTEIHSRQRSIESKEIILSI